MLISGSFTCEKCGSIVEWEYYTGESIYSKNLVPVKIDLNKQHPCDPVIEKADKFIFEIRCRECDTPRTITYNKL